MMSEKDFSGIGGGIGRASDIIECFGGIRPMSAKTGIPVTTIQGWKQRNVIPANRLEELLIAAKQHQIDISEFVSESGITSRKQGQEEIPMAEERETVIPVKSISREDKQNPDLRPAGHQATLLAAGGLILAALVFGAVMAIAPKVKNVTEQDIRIRELEQEVAAMREAQKAAEDDGSAGAGEISQQLSTLQNKIGQLAEQSKNYGVVIQDFQSGSVAERISKLEIHMNGLLQQANAFGLQEAMQKIKMLQSSPEGNLKLDSLVSTFVGTLQSAPSDQQAEADLAKLKNTNPDAAAAFSGVAPEDMKAAVILLGMAQLRQSLSRDNQSFDSDLKLLKMTLAKDDKSLQDAIDRLAPKAKDGVLTPDGLSKELRGLTGDIVSSSLSGENISIEEKAKARLADVVKVEKSGQQISGTQTQILIADAQKKLDAGDVAGAVSILQKIQGPAAKKTQPVIDAANANLLAGQVQQMLSQSLILKLKGAVAPQAPYTAGGGMKGLMNQIETIGNQVKSGVEAAQ